MNSRVKDDLVQSLKSFLPFEVVNPNPSNRYDKLLTYIKESDVPDNVNLFYPDKLTLVGNLGIGTRNPAQLLHLSGAPATGGIRIDEESNAIYQAYLTFLDTSGNFGLDVNGGGKLRFATGGVERLTILSTGNVGIGEDNPSALIHATQGGEPPAEGMLILEANTSSRQLRIQPPTTADNGFFDSRGGNMTFLDDGAEIFRYNASTISTSTGIKVGIGTASPDPDSTLHIHTGSAGSVTAHGSADDLVIEHASDAGLSILTPAANNGRIYFGSPTNNAYGQIDYDHATNDMVFATSGTGRLAITGAGNMGLGVTPTGYFADKFVVSAGNADGITIAASDTSDVNYLLFADGTSGNAAYRGQIVYDHGNDTMQFATAAAAALTIDSSQLIGIGTTTPSHKLSVLDTSGSVVRLQGISSYNYDIESQGDGTLWDHEIGSGNAKFSWSSSSAELMRLDSTGLGIGVTSPSALIQAQAADGTAGGAIKYTATSVASAYLSASPDGAVLATDTAGIVFRTGITGNDPTDTGTERVRISSGGYVGIGTTAPNYALSIFGSSTTAQGLNICNDGGGNGGRAAFIVTGCAYGAYGVGPHETWIIPETGCALTLGDYNLNIPIKFVSNGSETARFTQGSLGIGTASPAGQLAIMGDASSTQWALNVCDLNSTCSYGARVFGKGSAAGYPLFLVEQSGNELFRVNTGANTTLNTTEVAGRFTIQEGAYGVGGEARNDVSYGTLALMGCSPATGCVLPITFNMSAVGGRSRAAIAGVDLGNSGYCMGLAFYTRGALDGTQITTADEKMRITSGGYVGIGTTAPATKLHLSDGAFTQKFTFTSTNATAAVDAGVRIQNLSDTDNNFAVGTDFYNSTGFVTGRFGAIFRDAGDRNTDLYWATRANSAALYAHMFLTSAGRLGLNTCAPETRLHIGGTSQFIKMDSGATTHLYLGGENDFFALSHNRHPSTGAIDNAACGVGVLQYENAVGWTFSANTGGSFTSRMTILNGGKVGIGTATPNGNLHTVGSIQASTHMTAGGGIYISRAPGDESEPTRITSAASGAGTCTLYIGNAAIQTSSDVRVKNNIQCYTCSAVNVLDNARVVEFEYDKEKISDGSDFGPSSRGKYVGLIAQEMIEYARWAVNDGEGDPEGEHIWKAEYQHMVPILIKAIQELNERIEELESK